MQDLLDNELRDFLDFEKGHGLSSPLVYDVVAAMGGIVGVSMMYKDVMRRGININAIDQYYNGGTTSWRENSLLIMEKHKEVCLSFIRSWHKEWSLGQDGIKIIRASVNNKTINLFKTLMQDNEQENDLDAVLDTIADEITYSSDEILSIIDGGKDKNGIDAQGLIAESIVSSVATALCWYYAGFMRSH